MPLEEKLLNHPDEHEIHFRRPAAYIGTLPKDGAIIRTHAANGETAAWRVLHRAQQNSSGDSGAQGSTTYKMLVRPEGQHKQRDLSEYKHFSWDHEGSYKSNTIVQMRKK